MPRTKMKMVVDEGAYPLERAHKEDAGYDIRIPQDAVCPARGSLIFDSGVHVQIPHGYAGLIVSKSGLNVKHGITATGLIDEGYTGSIVVKLYNNGFQDYQFHKGDKATQLVLIKITTPSTELVDSLEDTERGTGGFGSTGV